MPYSDYERSKEWARNYSKDYYQKNKEKFKKKQKDRLSDPEKKARHKTVQRERLERNSELIDKIKIQYGCQNPNCLWSGEYVACELDLHHLSNKEESVSVLRHSSVNKIIKEINKCVVLCSNCHRRLHKGILELSKYDQCVVFLSDDNQLLFN